MTFSQRSRSQTKTVIRLYNWEKSLLLGLKYAIFLNLSLNECPGTKIKILLVEERSVKELYDLYSSQEEADTRLMLHFHDACTRFGINTAIIWSPDTDVFILRIHFSGQFDINIWFKTGSKQSTCYIPLHSIGQTIGADLCTLLLPYHALTGCGSTSCFKGKGKKKGTRCPKRKPRKISESVSLGDSLQIPQEVMKVCGNFVCQLYQSDPVTTDINKVRYNLF